jgi:hypothetical protein
MAEGEKVTVVTRRRGPDGPQIKNLWILHIHPSPSPDGVKQQVFGWSALPIHSGRFPSFARLQRRGWKERGGLSNEKLRFRAGKQKNNNNMQAMRGQRCLKMAVVLDDAVAINDDQCHLWAIHTQRRVKGF